MCGGVPDTGYNNFSTGLTKRVNPGRARLRAIPDVITFHVEVKANVIHGQRLVQKIITLIRKDLTKNSMVDRYRRMDTDWI